MPRNKQIILFFMKPWQWLGHCLDRLCRPIPWGLALVNYVHQRILRVNSQYPFSVNFTSRVVGNVKIGSNVWISFAVSGGCYIQANNGIEIGDDTIFAPGVKIISANHSFSDHGKWNKAPSIKIGRGVWIGANAVVLPGVQIGDGAVIGAGSVVTKSVGAGEVVAGNPAKLVRTKPRYFKIALQDELNPINLRTTHLSE